MNRREFNFSLLAAGSALAFSVPQPPKLSVNGSRLNQHMTELAAFGWKFQLTPLATLLAAE